MRDTWSVQARQSQNRRREYTQRMRVRNWVEVSCVVVLTVSGCTPDEPNVVEVQPEQTVPGPEPGGATNVVDVLNAVDAARTVQAPCDQIALLERDLMDMRRRYTQLHPEVIRVTQEIRELRDSLPTDEACGAQRELNQIRAR